MWAAALLGLVALALAVVALALLARPYIEAACSSLGRGDGGGSGMAAACDAFEAAQDVGRDVARRAVDLSARAADGADAALAAGRVALGKAVGTLRARAYPLALEAARRLESLVAALLARMSDAVERAAGHSA